MVRPYSLLRCQAASGGSNSSAQEDQGEASRSPWHLALGNGSKDVTWGRHPRNEMNTPGLSQHSWAWSPKHWREVFHLSLKAWFFISLHLCFLKEVWKPKFHIEAILGRSIVSPTSRNDVVCASRGAWGALEAGPESSSFCSSKSLEEGSTPLKFSWYWSHRSTCSN